MLDPQTLRAPSYYNRTQPPSPPPVAALSCIQRRRAEVPLPPHALICIEPGLFPPQTSATWCPRCSGGRPWRWTPQAPLLLAGRDLFSPRILGGARPPHRAPTRKLQCSSLRCFPPPCSSPAEVRRLGPAAQSNRASAKARSTDSESRAAVSVYTNFVTANCRHRISCIMQKLTPCNNIGRCSFSNAVIYPELLSNALRSISVVDRI